MPSTLLFGSALAPPGLIDKSANFLAEYGHTICAWLVMPALPVVIGNKREILAKGVSAC
jgi:hypothetical protein